MDPPAIIPPSKQQHLANQPNQHHPCHQENATTKANLSRILLQTQEQGGQTKLHGIDAQIQGQPCGIIRVTTKLDGGVRLRVPQRSNTIPSFCMPPKLESDDPNPTKWVQMAPPRSTCLWKPQGRIPATRALQESCLEGRPLRVLSPATARESHQNPTHPHCANEHPKAKI